MHELLPGLLASALLLLLAGCSRPASHTQVLARVGAHEITVAEFQQEIDWRSKNHRALPDARTLLNEMIAREARLQKARAAGLEQDPDVRHSYEALLTSKWEQRELMPRLDAIKVTPEEIRAAFEKERDRYTSPAKVRLALIYLKADPKLNEAQRAQLASRMAEARRLAAALPPGTRGFGAVAVNFSEDQASRYRGGDVGWFDQGQSRYRWPDEVVAAGFALKRDGEISDIISAEGGFYLVTRLDSREASVTPLEKVAPSLERRLLAEKRHQAEQRFEQELRASIPVQTHTQALAEIAYPSTAVAKAQESTPPALPGSP